MRVLVVEDDLTLAAGLVEGLERAGIRVDLLGAAEPAEGAFGLTVYDLAIVDIGLPGISGLETTRRLRQRLPQLRVLFFSMHDELPLVRQALEAGALGYLTKTSAPEVLLEAVKRTLAGHAYIEQPLATQLACNTRFKMDMF